MQDGTASDLRTASRYALRHAIAATPRRWPGLLLNIPVVVPAAALPRWLPKFSACVWLGMIFVDGRLEGAPTRTVEAVIAHEFGHVARGHALVALCVAMAALLLVIVPVPVSPLAALCVAGTYILLAAGLLWLRRPIREFEADAFGAKLVGSSEIVDALAWVSNWSGRGWTPTLLARRKALLQLKASGA